MKRILCTLIIILSTFNAKAMSYERAREEAIYLTDKMAYELNLNDQQYEYAYEINLDYLMGLRTADDIYGSRYVYRNADLRAILHDWQWTLFTAADYFFRPVYWRHGGWYFPIYTHYARNHFYFAHPHFYYSYRGGHCRDHYHAGFYNNRRPNWNGGFRGNDRRHYNDRHPKTGTSISANRGGRNHMDNSTRGRREDMGNINRRGHIEGNGYSFDLTARPGNNGESNRGYESFPSSRNTDRNKGQEGYGRNSHTNNMEHGNTRNYDRSSNTRSYDRGSTRNGSTFTGSSSRGTGVSNGVRSGDLGGTSRSGSINSGSRGGGMNSGSRGSNGTRGGGRSGR